MTAYSDTLTAATYCPRPSHRTTFRLARRTAADELRMA
jgi:hypothetical protein